VKLALLIVTGLFFSSCNITQSAAEGYADVSEPDASAVAAGAPTAELAVLLHEMTDVVPGVSIAVATSDGIQWAGTAGWSDVESREPVRKNHLFGIGSITKTFISVILHQLATEGRLSLDVSPASVLGDELNGIANVREATLRQLMNHTSGIPSWEDDPVWQSEGRGALLNPDKVWGKMETLTYIRNAPALFPAGEQFSYSNSNFTILGRVIEVVTGNELVTEIESRVRQPAKLGSFYLEGFEPVPEQRLATRYHFNTEEFRGSAGVNSAFSAIDTTLLNVSASNLSVEWAAGGMVASASDLARYGVAIFEGTLLNTDALDDLMTFRPTRPTDVSDSGTKPVPETGYGVFRHRLGDYLVLWHGGDVLGYSAWLFYEPESGVSLAILTNAGTMHAGPGVGAGPAFLQNDRFISAAIDAAGRTHR